MGEVRHSLEPGKGDWRRRVSEFVATEVFERLFRDGMTLVEEAAAYLDGPGRIDSRLLSRDLAVVYAAESMEITTRLMQAASWLVVHRAIHQRDIGLEEAGDEKYRLAPLSEPHLTYDKRLPAALYGLIERSRALYERLYRLDTALYTAEFEPGANAVIEQIRQLKSAAESGAFDPLRIWRTR
jgi:regulator of CtrA degradation